MALSRLQNFLNNPSGTAIYVDSNNFDATDSIENRGTSPGRPFYSLQRAILESAVFSYQPGRNNDRNDRTTIIVSPGTHYIDNRPGYSIENINGDVVFKKRVGLNEWDIVEGSSEILPFNEDSNFDIFDPNNDLFKFNSVNGGIILPRGTSIVGLDLRKTKIIPLFVPDPKDPDVDRSSILNVTGSCYFSQFTFFDADVTKFAYKNYSNSKYIPKFSHHKLTTFVYADGVNPVRIGDTQTTLTDLDMYYYKLTLAYNSLSGRDLPDYPSNLDFEPNTNEFKIVGELQENPLGISSIRAGNGDGSGNNNLITVTTANLQTKLVEPHNFSIDSPVIIRGITQSSSSYNGSFIINSVVDENTFTYITPSSPDVLIPSAEAILTATISTESDSVSSSSPYIFNCSLRSVYGMCGMWADGAKASGFKSMVVAQFTGISLQKDNDAYVIYDNGVYYDNDTLPQFSSLRPLYQNSRSIFKPEYESFHIRASNDSFIQAVSVFAIGYAKHFITESGADMSITNSNSNFGSNALASIGFKSSAFNRDDTGFITHIIPPRELTTEVSEVSWLSLDVSKIKQQTPGNPSNPSRLYLYSYDRKESPPPFQIENYKIGAKIGDTLHINFSDTETGQQISYSTPIYMTARDNAEEIIAKKEYKVSRNGSTNNISSDTIFLQSSHKLLTGEKVRIFSDTGEVPDGLETNKIYYAVTSEDDTQLKLSMTRNDSESGIVISGIGDNGGVLTIISSVSDKTPGEPGHPIQWDSDRSNWYLFTSSDTNINELYDKILELDTEIFGNESPTTFVKRRAENRSVEDRLYKIRYVIPKEYFNAKTPQAGYILQETNNVGITTVSVNEDTPILNATQVKNEKILVNLETASIVNGSQIVTATTEDSHKLSVGDIVKIQKVRSTNNPQATGITSTYNGEFEVLSIPSSRKFTYKLTDLKVNPGTFTNNINQRETSQQRNNIPLVSRKKYRDNFYIYTVDVLKDHVPGTSGQDGIYHLTLLSASVGLPANVGYGLSEKFFSQDIRDLYPQVDRDNPVSNPKQSVSYADLKVIGKITTNDKKNSITLESLNKFSKNSNIAIEITNVQLSGIGNTTITLTTNIAHSLNSLNSVSIASSGNNYPINSKLYSVELVDSDLSGENATCKFNTNSSGAIIPSTLRIIDPGSGYSIGDSLAIQGGNATATVTSINNNIGDGLELSGFNSTDINGLYEILDIPDTKTIVIHIPDGIDSYSANTNNTNPIAYIAGKGLVTSDIEVSTNLSSGVVTATTTYPHGLFIGNKFKFISNLQQYNGDYIVSEVLSPYIIKFNVSLDLVGSTPSSAKILKYAINCNSGALTRGEDNLLSRASTIYSGRSYVLASDLETTSSKVTLDDSSGLKRGDYISIGNEILRVSTLPINNEFYVLRNQFGTLRDIAKVDDVVKQIKILPVEIRRPSFMRASGHTFEYLGYGPGNYSTALPQRQDRILSDDEVITSQVKREQGGSVVYTGVNDLGEFYNGSKKVSATTGKETIIDAPVVTFSGDDLEGLNQGRQSGVFDEILIKDRITVEGGDNNRQTSQFYGPVNVNNRLTNLSDQGIVTKNLFIKGTAPQERLITASITKPTTTTGIPGTISLVSNITDHIGYVYNNSDWYPWGPISISTDSLNFTFSKLGIGVDADENFSFKVNGSAQIENLEVTGNLTTLQPITLGTVNFQSATISGTARFTGINSTYTQIHENGISLLNNLIVNGISTFKNDVYIDDILYPKYIELPNIKIGIANSNTIETINGDLVLDSGSNKVRIESNLDVNSGVVAITTNNGLRRATIEDASKIRLGVGNNNQESYLDLNNDTSTFSDYGLRIIRSSGSGNTKSSILHRGTQPLEIATKNSAELKILTNDQERIVVGSSGTVTILQNNSGENLRGGHLRLEQSGTGDVAISWKISNNNVNRKWYAGIDTSDGYSWVLAAPSTLISDNNENFITDSKLKVSSDGDVTISSKLSGGGQTLFTTITGTAFTSTHTGTYNLLNQNTTTINAFGGASTVNIANSGTSTVNIRGISVSNSSSTGALVVSGGVGIAGNLNIGGNINAGKIVSTGLTSTGDVNISASQLTVKNSQNETKFKVNPTTEKVDIYGLANIIGNIAVSSGASISGISTVNELNVYDNSTIYPNSNLISDIVNTKVSSSKISWLGRYFNGSTSNNVTVDAELTPTDTSGGFEWTLKRDNTKLITVTDEGNVIAPLFTGTIAGTAASAVILETTRTLWGQPFNGSQNVTGGLSSVTSIGSNENLIITAANNYDITLKSLGVGQIIFDPAVTGSVRFNRNVRFYNPDPNSNNYVGISATNVNTTSTLSFANGNTTLVSGTMVPTTGVGAAGTWSIDISGSAASVDKLRTTRQLWGQPFDGSQNVTGGLSGVTTITASPATNGSIMIASTGSGNIKLNSANGSVEIDDLRLYGSNTTNYISAVIPTLSANRTVTFTNGNTTLVSGTMVPTTGAGATGTWSIDISGSAASSNKLETTRTLWGQPFDGTQSISGSLTGVTTISSTGNILLSPALSGIVSTTNYFFGKFLGNVTDDEFRPSYAWSDNTKTGFYLKNINCIGVSLDSYQVVGFANTRIEYLKDQFALPESDFVASSNTARASSKFNWVSRYNPGSGSIDLIWQSFVEARTNGTSIWRLNSSNSSIISIENSSSLNIGANSAVIVGSSLNIGANAPVVVSSTGLKISNKEYVSVGGGLTSSTSPGPGVINITLTSPIAISASSTNTTDYNGTNRHTHRLSLSGAECRNMYIRGTTATDADVLAIGEIGTYALMTTAGYNTVDPGSTFAAPGETKPGSVLRYVGFQHNESGNTLTSNIGTAIPPGTWKCMGNATNAESSPRNVGTLWVRIA